MCVCAGADEEEEDQQRGLKVEDGGLRKITLFLTFCGKEKPFLENHKTAFLVLTILFPVYSYLSSG